MRAHSLYCTHNYKSRLSGRGGGGRKGERNYTTSTNVEFVSGKGKPPSPSPEKIRNRHSPPRRKTAAAAAAHISRSVYVVKVEILAYEVPTWIKHHYYCQAVSDGALQHREKKKKKQERASK